MDEEAVALNAGAKLHRWQTRRHQRLRKTKAHERNRPGRRPSQPKQCHNACPIQPHQPSTMWHASSDWRTLAVIVTTQTCFGPAWFERYLEVFPLALR